MMILRLRERLMPNDQGIAMILVLCVSLVISLLVGVGLAVTTSVLRGSTSHQAFEGSLAAAEAGIDHELSQVQTYHNMSPSQDYVTSAACNVPAGTLTTELNTTSTFSTAESERTWAKAVIDALPDTCLQSTPAGQYMAFRPLGRNTVYSMGWAPSKASDLARPRLLKAEYIFSPYQPGSALLTSGNLDFGGSVDVTTALTATGANVHTNGSSSMPASVTIDGTMTAAGTLSGCGTNVTGGCTPGSPVQSVPDANPRAVYTTYNSSTAQTSGWYDLCPDGKAKYPATTGPCTGSQVGSTGSAPGGWTFTAGTASAAPVWSINMNAVPSSPSPTVYYAYGSNVKMDGNNGVTMPYTILVEGLASTDSAVSAYAGSAICGEVGGDFYAKQVSLVPSSLVPGLGIMATGQISLNTQTQIGTDGNGAMVLAGHNLTTVASAGTTIIGAMVANNTCSEDGRDTNSPQGWTIIYDRTAQVPVSSLINTTLWLEYTG
jgi:Tfp pilus assembly protein PilX